MAVPSDPLLGARLAGRSCARTILLSPTGEPLIGPLEVPYSLLADSTVAVGHVVREGREHVDEAAWSDLHRGGAGRSQA